MKTLFITFLFSELIFSCLFSQQVIELKNPSFEDKPRKGSYDSRPIKGWTNCGVIYYPIESPPDIHPVSVPAWGVTMKPWEGATYLGLVARATGARESVSQKLSTPLQAEKCYTVSVYLALSKEYKSATMFSMEVLQDFSNPVELLVWGGNLICEHSQLLSATNAVGHYDWKKYTFEFTPDMDFKYVTLEAFFKEGFTEQYNGHVLVDGFSPITEMDCK